MQRTPLDKTGYKTENMGMDIQCVSDKMGNSIGNIVVNS